MATIKQEVTDAARECGITAIPSSWFGSTNDQLLMQALLRAISRDLLDRHDWTAASTTTTLTPVVEQTTWGFPDGFNRLSRGKHSVYEVSPNRRPVLPINNDGAWQEIQAYGSTGVQRWYRRVSAGLEFYRPIPAGATIKISYVTDQWIAGGISEWLASNEETAEPVFPSQLIRFGLIYRWRRQKGMPYAEELAEYEAIRARAMDDDRRQGQFDTSGPPLQPTHPMRVPVPDFIPSA